MKNSKTGQAMSGFMVSAVKGVCENMNAVGRMNIEDMMLQLEHNICLQTGRPVQFAERPVVCGSYFPQVVPCAKTGLIMLMYHMPDEGIKESQLSFFLNQIGILTLLSTAPHEYLDSIEPDIAIEEFLSEDCESGRLVRDIVAALQYAIS